MPLIGISTLTKIASNLEVSLIQGSPSTHLSLLPSTSSPSPIQLCIVQLPPWSLTQQHSSLAVLNPPSQPQECPLPHPPTDLKQCQLQLQLLPEMCQSSRMMAISLMAQWTAWSPDTQKDRPSPLAPLPLPLPCTPLLHYHPSARKIRRPAGHHILKTLHFQYRHLNPSLRLKPLQLRPLQHLQPLQPLRPLRPHPWPLLTLLQHQNHLQKHHDPQGLWEHSPLSTLGQDHPQLNDPQ